MWFECVLIVIFCKTEKKLKVTALSYNYLNGKLGKKKTLSRSKTGLFFGRKNGLAFLLVMVVTC